MILNKEFNPFFKHKFEHKDEIIKSSELHRILPADDLLSEKSFKALLDDLKKQLNIPSENLNDIYLSTISGYTEFVQSIPNLKYQNFNFTKGQLLLALIRASVALEEAENYTCPEVTNKSLDINQQERRNAIWQYIIFSSALFLDLGQAISSLDIITCSEKADNKHHWHPFSGPMTTNNNDNTHYYYKVDTPRDNKFNHKLNLLFANKIIPTFIFDWLLTEEDLFFEFLSLLEDEVSGSGTLHKLIVVSIRKLLNDYMGVRLPENILKLIPLHLKKKEEYHKNSFWKGVEYALRGDKNNKDKTAEQNNHGSDFLNWLRKGLADGSISINQKDSKVHVSKEGVFLLNPEIFIEFTKKHSKHANWQTVFKQFNQLGLTKYSDQNNNFQYNFPNYGPDISRKGIIIEDPKSLFGKQYIPDISPELSPDPARPVKNSPIFPTFRESNSSYLYLRKIMKPDGPL